MPPVSSGGATLAEIAEVLGHKTLAMVKRYAHLTERKAHELVHGLGDKLLGGSDE